MFGAAGLVSRNVTGYGNTLYAFDERGNVAQRVGSNGALLSTDLYDGFGKKRSGPADVWGFGGQAGYYTDGETGLILCTNRHYDPQSGRFLTRDPIGYAGGINLYSYTQNNPVNRLDPSGLYPILPVVPPVLPPRDGASHYWYNNQWNGQPQPGAAKHRDKWTWGKNAAQEGHDPHYDYRNGGQNSECRYYPGQDDPTTGEWEPKRGGFPRIPVQGPPAPVEAGEDIGLGGLEDGLEVLGPVGLAIGAGIAIYQWWHNPMSGITTLAWRTGRP